MKILMICDFFNENQQYQENLLAKYYLKNGHQVTIIASTFTSIFEYYSGNYKKDCDQKEYHVNGYKIIRQPYSINLFNKLRKLGKLKTSIKKESPDIIYIHGVPLNLIDPISFKKKNPQCKLIFDSHADYSNSAKNWLSLNILHKFLYRIIMKMLYKHVDKIFYITPDGGTFLNQVWGLPNNCIALLPLGTDSDYIREIKEKDIRLEIRNKLGISPSDFVVFTGGKLNRAKKTKLVIESFLLLNKEHTHLIIVGEAPDKTYKKELLELINAHPRIHLTGWIAGEEVYSYMLACDVAVFPASQSVLWQQAIGTELPLIIGQSAGQDATYLNRDNCTFLIEENQVNQENIYNLLNLLINDENLLKSMKLNASKTAIEFLSYDKISSLTLNV